MGGYVLYTVIFHYITYVLLWELLWLWSRDIGKIFSKESTFERVIIFCMLLYMAHSVIQTLKWIFS